MPLPAFVVNTQGLIVRDGRYLMIVRGENEAQAPGLLAPPGGKVEYDADGDDVVEDTLRRELLEEVDVTVGEMAYVRSNRFTLETGEPVVDIAFLCRFESGNAHAADPDEVAAIEWLTADEIAVHPKAPDWTRATVDAAEKLRVALGW